MEHILQFKISSHSSQARNSGETTFGSLRNIAETEPA